MLLSEDGQWNIHTWNSNISITITGPLVSRNSTQVELKSRASFPRKDLHFWVVTPAFLWLAHPQVWERNTQLHTSRVWLGCDRIQQNILLRLAQLHCLTGAHLRQMWCTQRKVHHQAAQGKCPITCVSWDKAPACAWFHLHIALLGCSANDKWCLWVLALAHPNEMDPIYTQRLWYMQLIVHASGTADDPYLWLDCFILRVKYFSLKDTFSTICFQLIPFEESRILLPRLLWGCFEKCPVPLWVTSLQM